MGSTRYFFQEIGKTIEITFKPEELKYIITCVHTKFSPYSSFLKTVKPKMMSAIKRNSSLTLKAYELRAYPKLLEEIIFGQKNILYYFEGMEENCHNKILIEELKKILKANPELKTKKIFNDLVQHVYDCTVQLTYYKDREFFVYTPLGVKKEKVNTSYLGKKLKDKAFISTHGKDGDGARYAVRVLEDEETINGLKNLEKLWQELREECRI